MFFYALAVEQIAFLIVAQLDQPAVDLSRPFTVRKDLFVRTQCTEQIRDVAMMPADQNV